MKPLRVCFLLAAVALGTALPARAAVVRGPYLQQLTPTEVTVVWRTDNLVTGTVRYGASPETLLASQAEALPANNHAVRLVGLLPGAPLYYRVETNGEVFRFQTAPDAGTDAPFRFFAWGDSGDGSAQQLAVAHRLSAETGAPHFSLVLGGVALPSGAASSYDPGFFAPYRPLLPCQPAWPAFGPTDNATDGGLPYTDAFLLPANNPTINERYYSFDYGNAHFLALATDGVDHHPGSPQLLWAADDLAASNALWKIAFFARSPYSGGTALDDGDIQAGIVPLLEQAGVDLVLSARSRAYERTELLSQGAVFQFGADGGSSYFKLGQQGTLYVVSGAGAQGSPLQVPAHPLMAKQLGGESGVAVIDVAGPVLRGYFLQSSGKVFDLFTLTKSGTPGTADTDGPHLLGVRGTRTQVTVAFNEPVAAGSGTNGAERPGNYAIDPPVSVTAAALGTDLRTVTLTTGVHEPGRLYTLTVSRVQDRAGTPNAVAANTHGAYDVAVTDGGTSGGGGGGGVGEGGPGEEYQPIGCHCSATGGASTALLVLAGLAVALRGRRSAPRR